MANVGNRGGNKSGGQRGNLASASGRKEHNALSNSHKGSRVEPSHTGDKLSNQKAKTAAKKVASTRPKAGAKSKPAAKPAAKKK